MTEYTFVIIGEPQSLQRHRYSKGRMYNPSKAKQDEFADKIDFDEDPLLSNLEVSLDFYFERPKSHILLKSKPLYPTRKDLDNLVKFVLDALNKKVYDDDRQIVKISASKHYTDDDTHKTEIKIRCL